MTMKFFFSAMKFQYTSLKGRFVAYFQEHAYIFYGKLRKFKRVFYRYRAVQQSMLKQSIYFI